MGRDRTFQAILPLRGVILNVEKARIDKMLSNEELRTLITALGTGIVQEDFDFSKLRYGKIIILTDADIDGAHIRTLLLTFFFRQMLPLIDNGRLFVAKPPLYRIARKGKKQYVDDDRALQKTLLELGAAEARLRCRMNGEAEVELAQESFRALVALLGELEARIGRIEAQGILFHRYLELRDAQKGGALPLYRVVFTDKQNAREERLFYSEHEYDAFVRELHMRLEAAGEDLQIVEGENDAVPEVEVPGNSIRPFRFDEAGRLAELVDKIEALGIPIACLYAPAEADEGASARFAIQSNGTVMRVSSLLEVIPALRELGREGLDIQRYKGLGEMDAAELAETTLSPTSRKTVLVTVGDAVKADNYFSILAGKDVKARREFIERHALEVRNLDI